MKKIAIILSLCVLALSSISAQTIDTKNSVVNFTIKNMGVRTVPGTFTGMKGSVSFDVNSLKTSLFEVCIDASTVNTENEKRDTHLKNEDFFEVETYPTICFKSKSITKTKDGFNVNGSLTMHGVTKLVSMPFTFEDNTLTGTLSVNRFDYKIGENFKKFMVGADAELEIICKLK